MRSGALVVAALSMLADIRPFNTAGFPRFSVPGPKRRDPVPTMVTAPDNEIAKWNAEVEARRAAKKHKRGT